MVREVEGNRKLGTLKQAGRATYHTEPWRGQYNSARDKLIGEVCGASDGRLKRRRLFKTEMW